jgi:hypothetical protein
MWRIERWFDEDRQFGTQCTACATLTFNLCFSPNLAYNFSHRMKQQATLQQPK